MFSSNVPQAYMSPSDAKKVYVQQKLVETSCSEMSPKSEYASPQDTHQTTTTQQAPTQFLTYQEIDQLSKQEHHLQATRGPSAQEKRKLLHSTGVKSLTQKATVIFQHTV